MIDKLNITEKTKIYVLCPSNLKTGGTELLHQLVSSLLFYNKDACKEKPWRELDTISLCAFCRTIFTKRCPFAHRKDFLYGAVGRN